MRRAIVYLAVVVLVLAVGQGGFAPSPLDSATAPHRWSLVEWEITHFLNKWRYRIREVLPWHSPPGQEEGLLVGFFSLTGEIRELERQLITARGNGSSSVEDLSAIKEELKRLSKRQSRLKPQVEERLEAQVSAILDKEGFKSRIGLIWPPVDTELGSPPTVLALSPREVIQRKNTITLRPNLKVEDKEALEDKIFREQNLSALVVDIGGIATYPSIVVATSGLRHALTNTAHEWLHQYWFFRPLGWNFWKSPQMMTLNESAADLAGRELGDRLYEAITGKKIERQDVADQETGFDFREEMHKTRLRVDQLLAEGKVEEAERYMEERRQLFVGNGFFIRKLNQAFFAFFGTYAANPASVSPIDGQLQQLRASVNTTGDFIREVSGFSSYQEFKDRLKELGIGVTNQSSYASVHSRACDTNVPSAVNRCPAHAIMLYSESEIPPY